MKKIFCTVFCLLFAATSLVFAQKTATESAAETTARWAKKYNLNAVQTEKLLVITERKLKNEAEFETLRTTNSSCIVPNTKPTSAAQKLRSNGCWAKNNGKFSPPPNAICACAKLKKLPNSKPNAKLPRKWRTY